MAAASKSILNLAHEPQVLKQGLLCLNDVLKNLEPLHNPLEPPGGSVLLRELVNATTSYGSNEGMNILVNNISLCSLLFLYLWHRCSRYL